MRITTAAAAAGTTTAMMGIMSDGFSAQKQTHKTKCAHEVNTSINAVLSMQLVYKSHNSEGTRKILKFFLTCK